MVSKILPKKSNLHCMGIGGSGMSAVAAIASLQGYTVSGCDLNTKSEYLKSLQPLEIQVYHNHNVAHLKHADILLYSPAVMALHSDNPEYLQGQMISHMSWQAFLGQYLMAGKQVISVAGTHGKGTVAGLISHILCEAKMDPTCVLGASLLQWGRNWRLGGSSFLVHEADEYHDNFLNYTPNAVVLNNIEMDHPEYFPSFEALEQSFIRFIRRLPKQGILVTDLSQPAIQALVAKINRDDISILDYYAMPVPSKLPAELKVAFNRQNVKAAIAACQTIGIPTDTIYAALDTFEGLSRRFEKVETVNDIVFYSDYAHHPTAVSSVLQALADLYLNRRIVAVFQPHQYRRTKVLFDDFVAAFSNADVVVISDIYGARETDQGLVHSRDLVAKIEQKNVYYGGNLDQTSKLVTRLIHPGDAVVFMGAGDILQSLQQVIKNFR